MHFVHHVRAADLVDCQRNAPILKHLRMSKATLSDLLDELSEFPEAKASPTKSGRPFAERLVIGLHRLASGCSLRESCLTFGLPEGTAHNYFTQTLACLMRLFSKYVESLNPTTEEAFATAAADFESIHGLIGCVGVLDGTQFRIEKPAKKNTPTAYWNYKEKYTIGAQLMCNAHGFITEVLIGYPGSVHDASALKEMNFWKRRDRVASAGYWVAADAGYPLLGSIITPFRVSETTPGIGPPRKKKKKNNNNSAEPQLSPNELAKRNRTFNAFFCGRRCLIERVIGHLKNRWRVLKRRMEFRSLSLVKSVVISCIVLHNFVIAHDDVPQSFQDRIASSMTFNEDSLDENGDSDVTQRDATPSEDMHVSFWPTDSERQQGVSRRDALVKLFNTEEYIALRKSIRNQGRTCL